MDWDYRSRAELKRAEAEEYRLLARVVPPATDRKVLLRQAADLDKEATELEQRANSDATAAPSSKD
jgi:hypothetical protein